MNYGQLNVLFYPGDMPGNLHVYVFSEVIVAGTMMAQDPEEFNLVTLVAGNHTADVIKQLRRVLPGQHYVRRNFEVQREKSFVTDYVHVRARCRFLVVNPVPTPTPTLIEE